MAYPVITRGLTLSVDSVGGSSPTFIAHITSLNGPTTNSNTVDITALDDTARRKIVTLPDNGEFTFGLNFDSDEAGTGAGQSILRTALADGIERVFVMKLPAATPSSGATGAEINTLTFNGLVKNMPFSADLDDVAKFEITLEVTGAATWSNT